jgi:hypothetical protein
MRFVALFTAFALSLPALADDSVIPPPTCTKPAVPAPGTKLDKKGSDLVNANAATYQACVQAYLAERRGIAKKHEEIAKANTEASNALVKEFNGFAAGMEAFTASQKPPSK